MNKHHPVVAGVMADKQGSSTTRSTMELRIMFARIVSLIVALVCVLSVSDAEAARRCRKVSVFRNSCRTSCQNGSCTISASSRSRTVTHGGSMQAWAEEEARMMAALGTNGHVRPAPMGTFVGVGCNGVTCQGSGTLVGEAHINGKSVRVWKR